MKKSTAATKPAVAAKPAKAKAAQCACPYCDEEVTADRTPLFCTPCTMAAGTAKQAKKPSRKTV